MARGQVFQLKLVSDVGKGEVLSSTDDLMEEEKWNDSGVSLLAKSA